MSRVPLRVSMAWAFSANISHLLANGSLLVILARLPGGPWALGAFGLASAVAAPVFTLSDSDLHNVLASDQRKATPFEVYQTVRVGAAFTAFLITSTCGLILDPKLETLSVFVAVGAWKAMISVSGVQQALFQQADCLALVFRARALQASALLGCGIIALALGLKPAVYLTLVAVSSSCVVIFHDIPSSRKFGRPARARALLDAQFRRRCCTLACSSMPLAMGAFLNSLTASTPRYVINAYYGKAVLGQFVAIAYSWVALHTIAMSVGAALLPRIAAGFAVTKTTAVRQLKRACVLVAAIGGLSVAMAIVLGEDLLMLLFGKPFIGLGTELTLMCVVGTLSGIAVILWLAATALAAYRQQMFINASLALLMGIMAFALIIPWSIIGATLASGFVAGGRCLALLGLLRHRLSRDTSSSIE